MLCRLYAIVINVLHFCFELCALKMTSKMKHMKALFFSLLSYRIRFVIMLRLYRLSAQICYVYIVLFWTLKAQKWGISSTTTNVQHPPGWCDGSHIAPERPPHTIPTQSFPPSPSPSLPLPFPFPFPFPSPSPSPSPSSSPKQTNWTPNNYANTKLN